MTSKLTLWKILFHILMFQQNLTKTRHNLHMNIVIAYREQYVVLSVGDYDVPGNVQSRPSHLKCCKNEVIVYVKNSETYNKRQHVHNLLLTMMHCNCLETKTRRPQDDGIVEKWTQYMDSAMRKCGSKNDWQSRATTTHNFFYVARMAKFCCRVFLQHHKSWKFF
jgi:hypothetical protein